MSTLRKILDQEENIAKSIKYSSLFAIFLGFYYLRSFLGGFGIPFPLELSVLPTALLAIGATAIIIVAILIAYLIFASFAQTGLFNVDYEYLVRADKKGIITPSKLNLITNIFIIYLFPTILFFCWPFVFNPTHQAGFFQRCFSVAIFFGL